jgi:drug/metabolite transporter (DMT)-like permease
LIFLAIVLASTRDRLPTPLPPFWPWLVLGALTQIGATALMLAAMNLRSFVVTTAYIKTEPIEAALFGFVFLSDQLTALKVLAIVIATAGVVVTAIRSGGERGFGDPKPTLLGLTAAAGFALSAVGYRGAILAVPGVSFVTAATFTLVLGLFLQTVVLTGYLLALDRETLRAIFRLWKPSMFAGFTGAFASQFWFLAFALTAVANVRTLGLIEVLYAQAISRYSFKQKVTAREVFGIVLIVVGVGLLVVVQ